MQKYILLSLLIAGSVLQLNAQSVGINIINPTAALDIHTIGNTNATSALKIENSAGSILFNLSNSANVSINKGSSDIRLDLRSAANTNNIIGLGTASLTASQAKEGAMRYQPTTKNIEYSDGVEWYYLKTTDKRACIIYVNNDNAINVPHNNQVILGGWVSAYDPDGYFNSNGTFTAPKDGIYYTILSFAFVNNNGNAGRDIEARWLHYRNGVLINSVNAKTSYVKGFVGLRQAICYASFMLKKGDTLRPAAWHNLGYTQTLATGPALGGYGGFNYLSVIIQ